MILVVKREVLRGPILHLEVYPRELLLWLFRDDLKDELHGLIGREHKIDKPFSPLRPQDTLH
jgi:hypothetical protein